MGVVRDMEPSGRMRRAKTDCYPVTQADYALRLLITLAAHLTDALQLILILSSQAD